MRRARHSERSLSIYVVALAIALCATAALALPPKAEAVIRLGSANTVSLSNGLVGYWTFDGAVTHWDTGTTQDISGNGNTGKFVRLSTTTAPTGGKIGQALQFNETNYVNVSGNTIYAATGTPFSVSAWVDLTSFANDDYPGVMYLRTNTTYPYEIFFSDDNAGGFGGVNIGSQDTFAGIAANASSTQVTGKWLHLVITYNGVGAGTPSNYKIYINGASQSFLPPMTPGSDKPQETLIGGDDTPYESWNGKIDDVRVYNRALTAGEVAQLYKLGTANAAHSNTIISNGLVGYWTFDGGATNWTTGQTRDLAGTSTGRLISMSTSSSPVGGKIGQALNFTRASSQYISLANNIQYQPPFSFSAWVNYADIRSVVMNTISPDVKAPAALREYAQR
jgi:hypothetical protein